YRLLVSVTGVPLTERDTVRAELFGAGADHFVKVLNAGDPDLYFVYRPEAGCDATLTIQRGASGRSAPQPVRIEWTPLELPNSARSAIEAEPNDSWRQANTLVLGRDVYGSADDVDYLENQDEGRSGLDWFRFEVANEEPILVYFQLDLLDRDVSANMRV